MEPIPCPFTYSNGKVCPGHIMRVEIYKADVIWDLKPDGRWESSYRTRSHWHLFCSEKGNHAGFKRQYDRQMRLYGDQLPEALAARLFG
jgi:hypothetical protein